MSIRVIDRVWRCGRYSGGTLLILLAMADWASDDGSRVFPTTRQLAAKSRMTERQVRTCTRQLEQDGVIVLVSAATGRPGQANEYRIVLKELQPIEETDREAPSHSGDGGRIFTPEVQDRDGGSLEQGGRKSVTETAEVCAHHIDKPSREPSTQPSSEPSTAPGLFPEERPFVPPTPAQILGQAYEVYADAAQLHGWSVVQKSTGARDAALRARLKDVAGLEGWIAALAKAGRSDFLCGRAAPREGKTPFRLDFDFLTRESSFVRLMEGKYDNRETSGPGTGGGGFLEAARRGAMRDAASGPD